MEKFTENQRDETAKTMRTRGQYRYSKVLLGRTRPTEDDVISLPSNDSDNWSVISRNETNLGQADAKPGTKPDDVMSFWSDASQKWSLVDKDLNEYEDDYALETSSNSETHDLSSTEQDDEEEPHALHSRDQSSDDVSVGNNVFNDKYPNDSYFEKSALLESDSKIKRDDGIERAYMSNGEVHHEMCPEVRTYDTTSQTISDKKDAMIAMPPVNGFPKTKPLRQPKHWLNIEKYAQSNFADSRALPTYTFSVIAQEIIRSRAVAQDADEFKSQKIKPRSVTGSAKDVSIASRSGVGKTACKKTRSSVIQNKSSINGKADPFLVVYQEALRRL